VVVEKDAFTQTPKERNKKTPNHLGIQQNRGHKPSTSFHRRAGGFFFHPYSQSIFTQPNMNEEKTERGQRERKGKEKKRING